VSESKLGDENQGTHCALRLIGWFISVDKHWQCQPEQVKQLHGGLTVPDEQTDEVLKTGEVTATLSGEKRV
jgi:hypothetical protein